MPVLLLIGETLVMSRHHSPHPPDKKGAEPDEEIERYFHVRQGDRCETGNYG